MPAPTRDANSGVELPGDDPAPWRARLDELLKRGEHDDAIEMTTDAMRRLRSDLLLKGEPYSWLVRIHADRKDPVRLARALLLTGGHTTGLVPGLWTDAVVALLPDKHIEALRHRVGPDKRRFYDDMFHGKGVPPTLLRALGVPPQLDNLRTSALQAYGALCLCHFCAAREISEPSVAVLALHLVDLVVAENWPNWEEALCQLDLSGGGDPLPPPLDALEPESLRNTFERVVEFAVEIGIGDLYGASTEGPHLDCAIVMELMERDGVAPPPIPPELHDVRGGQSHANPANRAAHRALRAACLAALASAKL